MKLAFAVLLFAVSASAQNQPNHSFHLPPACGPKNVTFTEPSAAAPSILPQPSDGKAQVFFIQDDGSGGKHQHYTLKIGLDGAWVGAYKQNAYFAVTVEPGEHHICANVQSTSYYGHILALAHFTAEAGKVYYFRTQFLAGLNSQYPVYPDLKLDQPDTDEAKFLLSSYPLTTLRPSK